MYAVPTTFSAGCSNGYRLSTLDSPSAMTMNRTNTPTEMPVNDGSVRRYPNCAQLAVVIRLFGPGEMISGIENSPIWSNLATSAASTFI